MSVPIYFPLAMLSTCALASLLSYTRNGLATSAWACTVCLNVSILSWAAWRATTQRVHSGFARAWLLGTVLVALAWTMALERAVRFKISLLIVERDDVGWGLIFAGCLMLGAAQAYAPAREPRGLVHILLHMVGICLVLILLGTSTLLSLHAGRLSILRLPLLNVCTPFAISYASVHCCSARGRSRGVDEPAVPERSAEVSSAAVSTPSLAICGHMPTDARVPSLSPIQAPTGSSAGAVPLLHRVQSAEEAACGRK